MRNPIIVELAGDAMSTKFYPHAKYHIQDSTNCHTDGLEAANGVGWGWDASGGVVVMGKWVVTSYMCCELELSCNDAHYFPLMSVNNKMCWVDFI